MTARREHLVFWALGGRKCGYALLAITLFTVMALLLEASFTDYTMAILGALGLALGSVAYEDVRRQEVS